MLKPYIYGAIAILLASSHIAAYTAGKRSITAKLASDRIEILQDGKAIDESVLSADDSSLICILTDCN